MVTRLVSCYRFCVCQFLTLRRADNLHPTALSRFVRPQCALLCHFVRNRFWNQHWGQLVISEPLSLESSSLKQELAALSEALNRCVEGEARKYPTGSNRYLLEVTLPHAECQRHFHRNAHRVTTTVQSTVMVSSFGKLGLTIASHFSKFAILLLRCVVTFCRLGLFRSILPIGLCTFYSGFPIGPL